jgi:hypothetical protein
MGMRAGQVWSEGQAIGERGLEVSRGDGLVDEVETVGTQGSAPVAAALVSDALAQGGLVGEHDPGIEQSPHFSPAATPAVDGGAQEGRASLAPSGQVRPQPAEEETGLPSHGPKLAPVLGLLSEMALSSAALGSLVLWRWRRAERDRPPLPTRRWGLDLKRPFALEIETLPHK